MKFVRAKNRAPAPAPARARLITTLIQIEIKRLQK